ncbi:anaerobic ribonucleoside-triphosphate reductase activating protein [[Clostridium] aminophilum]|uniref:anaerobic ribonucleoside-triphosphate reductase activating protein n=1 Tax=[Clostridium] aminophilum TaxID=1526 RepID=UPI0026F331FB|nr:anaerobic ribonucleoside-triphosphate reductase activating protein [[Clostridium] aminophilum]MDD6195681.1 anaerobic ribonucleoside-triphosphate reductase activating protein [[Clostridium] aminophilum]
MHIGEIIKTDCANGIGIRLTLFVSGCTNCCPGCFQPQTWDFNYGIPYTEEIEQSLMDELKKPYYDGITILGGEPFEIPNQEVLVHLILRIREELPQKTIWMFTGFTYDRDLVPDGCRYTKVTDSILDHIDILVDGKFVEELKNITLKFRGSENQRIIDMKKTRAQGSVVLDPLND